MKEFTYKIKSEIGIHMAPATKINEAAEHFDSRITISKDGVAMNGKSLLGLVSLCVRKDDVVTVRAEGSDEDAACAALEKHFRENL